MKTLILWVYGLIYKHSGPICKKLKITELDFYKVRWKIDATEQQKGEKSHDESETI